MTERRLKAGAVCGVFAAGEDDACSHDERQEELEDGNVERERRDRTQDVGCAELGGLLHFTKETGNRPMLDGDTLGRAGGAGRVHDVSERAGRDSPSPTKVSLFARERRIDVDDAGAVSGMRSRSAAEVSTKRAEVSVRRKRSRSDGSARLSGRRGSS